MLRASSQKHDEDIQFDALMNGGNAGPVAGADQLLAFAQAIFDGEPKTIATTRDALVAELGVEAMIDAAGVASNFQRMVRIADATGIALGAQEQETADIREALGINAFAARA